MLKAVVNGSRRKCLMLGLSFGNLQKFKDEPLDTFIPIDGNELGIDFDIILFSGETEADMERLVKRDIAGSKGEMGDGSKA